MGAEQVGFSERGEDGEEWLGAADFIAEKFKGMGQGVADGKSQFTFLAMENFWRVQPGGSETMMPYKLKTTRQVLT